VVCANRDTETGKNHGTGGPFSCVRYVATMWGGAMYGVGPRPGRGTVTRTEL